MVVPVLMVSCQFSEKWKKGPAAAQATTSATQIRNAIGLPAARAVALAKDAKNLSMSRSLMRCQLQSVIQRR